MPKICLVIPVANPASSSRNCLVNGLFIISAKALWYNDQSIDYKTIMKNSLVVEEEICYNSKVIHLNYQKLIKWILRSMIFFNHDIECSNKFILIEYQWE